MEELPAVRQSRRHSLVELGDEQIQFTKNLPSAGHSTATLQQRRVVKIILVKREVLDELLPDEREPLQLFGGEFVLGRQRVAGAPEFWTMSDTSI